MGLKCLSVAVALLFFVSPISNATDREPDTPSTSSSSTVSASGSSDSSATGGSVGNINITVPTVSKADITDSSASANLSNQIIHPDDIKIKNVPSTRAPYANSTNPCIVALSVGASFMGGSGSFGKGFLDEGCDDRQNAMVWSNLGVPAMGLWIMCRSQGTARHDIGPEVCDAMVAQLQIEAELQEPAEYEGGEVEPPKFYAQAEDPRIEEQQEEIEELREELEELKRKEADHIEQGRFSEIQEKLRQIPEIKRGS